MNYFEEEVIARLSDQGSKIHDEIAVIEVVTEIHEEFLEIIDDIHSGAISIGLEPDEHERYH